MKKDERDDKKDEEQQYRGMVTITYVRGMLEQFKRLASKYLFRTAFKPGKKVKELKTRSQQPLGENQKGMLYKIPCKCERAVYVGEKWRQLKTSKKEHESKVRLTNEDLRNGKLAEVNERIGKEDGGSARHSVECLRGIDWEKTRVVMNECGLRQRKAKKGIESLREIHSGTKVLISFESLMTWRPLRKAKQFVNQDTLLNMFNALVLPHFTYCSNVWSDGSCSHIEKLKKLQSELLE